MPLFILNLGFGYEAFACYGWMDSSKFWQVDGQSIIVFSIPTRLLQSRIRSLGVPMQFVACVLIDSVE